MKHYLMLKGFLKVGGCQLLFFNVVVVPAFRCNLSRPAALGYSLKGFPLQSGSLLTLEFQWTKNGHVAI
jgi:hypothetical protein